MQAIEKMNLTEHFFQYGYVVLENAVPIPQVDAFWSEFEQLRHSDPLLQYAEYGDIYLGANLEQSRRMDLRVINLQARSPKCRHMAMHKPIVESIDGFFGKPMSCIQTLTYSKSSRQGAHSDLLLVCPPYAGQYERSTLCASWVACEDANEDNGTLIIYPGSHKIPKLTLEQCGNDYGRYVNSLQDSCAKNGIRPEFFLARKGDVLIWHGDFIHAGGIPRDSARSRASLVCHYAAVSVEHAMKATATVHFMGNDHFVLADREA